MEGGTEAVARGAAGAAAIDLWEGKRKLLAVADVQTGYHHDSISHALATIERLGRESGAYVTTLRTESQLITRQAIVGQGSKYQGRHVNARGLSAHDALLLLPSGAGTLTLEQRRDLLGFVRDDGGGLILGHGAIVGYYDWPEFGELAGARLEGEFTAPVTVLVEDPGFPGADAFGSPSFSFSEQHPILKAPYSRADVHVVMRLDPESVTPAHRARRTDDDFPVVWTRRYGKGRVYHVSWGHLESTWDDRRFQKMVLGGILWAMGAIAG